MSKRDPVYWYGLACGFALAAFMVLGSGIDRKATAGVIGLAALAAATQAFVWLTRGPMPAKPRRENWEVLGVFLACSGIVMWLMIAMAFGADMLGMKVQP